MRALQAQDPEKPGAAAVFDDQKTVVLLT